ncbi:MAG: hypothetical protein J6V54_10815 [Bacteroidales bacterium]|nr:hypothetical protein [Bacteroidales bacterium]
MSQDNNVLRALAQFSVRCEKEALDGFNDIHDMLGFATKGETFGAVIERFKLPQVVADRTKELEQQLTYSTAEVERLTARNLELEHELATAVQDLELQKTDADRFADSTRQTSEELQNKIAMLQQELQQARQTSNLPTGSVVIAFTAENLAVLDYVCNRESRRRNTAWSRSHVINHFINSRFIKGELNGDLRSVSDTDIEKIRKTLAGQQTTDNGQQTADRELDL